MARRFCVSDESEAALGKWFEAYFDKVLALPGLSDAARHGLMLAVGDMLRDYPGDVFETVVTPTGRAGKNIIGFRISGTFEAALALAAEKVDFHARHSGEEITATPPAANNPSSAGTRRRPSRH
jgi:hypothetical protein